MFEGEAGQGLGEPLELLPWEQPERRGICVLLGVENRESVNDFPFVNTMRSHVC
jgi:hypothetical protein